MAYYFVDTELGCGIREERDRRTAERNERREIGTLHVIRTVRLATREDIEWVHGMGGYLPSSLLKHTAPRVWELAIPSRIK